MGIAGEREMRVAEESAASDEVVDYFVEEGEIRHGDFLTGNRVSRWGGGGGIGAQGNGRVRKFKCVRV